MGEIRHRIEISIFKDVASRFAEAILVPADLNEERHNVFGRPVQVNSKGGLSHILGTAATGMRSAALVRDEDLEKEIPVLSSFHRLHVPLTLVVSGHGCHYLPQLIQSGCIVFNAVTAQEMSDLILIGQVVSEKTLTPVVLLTNDLTNASGYKLPSEQDLVNWFGNPDARVPDPTAAQEMVLGASRRRMPAWFHIDQPLFAGARKKEEMVGLEKAATAIFDQSHYQVEIDNTFADFARLTDRDQSLYTQLGSRKNKNLIYTIETGKDAGVDKALLDKLDKSRTSLVISRQIFPIHFPESSLSKDIEKVLILEPIADSAQQGFLFAQAATSGLFEGLHQENGWYIQAPSAQAIGASLDHLLSPGHSVRRFWLDVSFVRDQSRYPKHEVLIQQIKRNYPDLEQITVHSDSQQTTVPAQTGSIPGVVRRYANEGPPFARISRFYDDTFCLYENAKDEMVADPFQAYPVMPASSAAFSDMAGKRDHLPVFSSRHCKDIDELILSCPFGALPSALITVESFVEIGIKWSGTSGYPVTQLIPFKKKWIQACIRVITENPEIENGADFLEKGLEEMLAATELDNEKEALLIAESRHIIDEIGSVQVVVDQHLFIEQERRSRGTGELFTLAVDPFNCTACGYCTHVGKSSCMRLEPQDKFIDSTKEAFDRFDRLPLTPQYSVDRLIESDDFDPFAALMLNKEYYQSFSTSENGELTQDETVIRYFLGLNAHLSGPQKKQEQENVEVLIGKLNDGIRTLLSNSIPVNQLNSLMDILSAHKESHLNMNDIFTEWGRSSSFSPVEKQNLERKLNVLEDLKSLHKLLRSGITGKGRPAATVILDKSLGDLAVYPYNPFSVPVLFAAKENTAAMALGACEGHVRHALDQVRLIRRAELEAADRYIPSRHDAELVGLTWEQLTDDERRSIAHVMILADSSLLSGSMNDQLMTLLQSHYPVKICLIDKGERSPEHLLSEMQIAYNDLWPFIGQGEAFIGKGTLANRNYLYRLMQRALSYDGMAMVTVLAPDASAFEIHPSNWMQLAGLAVSSRAFLQMAYDPEKPAESVASRLLTNIEQIDNDLHVVKLKYEKDGVETTVDYAISWADWAFLQKNLSGYFKKLEDGKDIVFFNDVIASGGKIPADKKVAILRVNAEKEPVYYAVDELIVKACRITVMHLRLLREWAGLYTQFPDKLKTMVNEELRTAYELEMDQYKKELESQKADWEANYLQELKIKMKETLLNMSGM